MTKKTVTRQELADALSQEVGLNKQEAAKILDHTLNMMVDSIVDEGQLKLSAFGSFNVREKSTRIGRNPRTGVEVPITPRKTISFKASNQLKSRVEKKAAS